MKLPVKQIFDRLDVLERRIQEAKAVRLGRTAGPLDRYAKDFPGYVRDILKSRLTPDQERIAAAFHEPPYRVMVKSGHGIGKSWLAAAVTSWWYDTRNPSVAVTTAPTERDVYDIIWAELRLQRQRAGRPDTFVGPSIAEMRTSEDHYAKGFTARSSVSFQGRHPPRMLIVFDEAEGIDGTFWETAGTMFQPNGDHLFLAILNPTTTTSQSYQEEMAVGPTGQPKWAVFEISSLDHPNIAAELAGRPVVVPGAVSLAQAEDWVAGWFEPIDAGDVDHTRDIEFPPGSGKWHRPGPEGESRVLGRRPSAGTYGVWSEQLWSRAAEPQNPLAPTLFELPEIGGDVARYGDDKTDIHTRIGPASWAHEEHSGWDVVRTADRVAEIADEMLTWANARIPAQQARYAISAIRIKIDDTGVGGGVTDILRSRGYNVVAVNAGEVAASNEKYPRLRDELWFSLAERCRAGKLDLSRLPRRVRNRLRSQALAPQWAPTADGRRQVEPKKDTKKRIGRSPDGMDAVNLAYWEPPATFGSVSAIGEAVGNRSPAVGVEAITKRRMR
jgi:hypothetical protein